LQGPPTAPPISSLSQPLDSREVLFFSGLNSITRILGDEADTADETPGCSASQLECVAVEEPRLVLAVDDDFLFGDSAVDSDDDDDDDDNDDSLLDSLISVI